MQANSAQKLAFSTSSSLRTVENIGLQHLINHVWRIIDLKLNGFIPTWIQVFADDPCCLSLPIKIYLNKSTGGPLAIFGHEIFSTCHCYY